MTTLRLLLGDQLNPHHSWFRQVNSEVVYVLMEVREETDGIRHHIQKIVAFFAAMRAFAQALRESGHRVVYLELDHPENQQNFLDNLKALLRNHQAQRFEWMLPDQWDLGLRLRGFAEGLEAETGCVDSEHFLAGREAVQLQFQDKKTYVMEAFYRQMRQKHQVLLEDGKPQGGRWNFDQDNRRRYDGAVPLPEGMHFGNEVSELAAMIRSQGIKTLGGLEANGLRWPVTRLQAESALQDFVRHRLPHFGTYQDALTSRSSFLFHSLLSFALNVKLLHPREVIDAAIREWERRPEDISLAQLEGFVRQILGWREYLRGVYWAQMPEYRVRNHFQHSAPLPSWYWTGETRMKCLQHAIRQSLDHAYAHHIQRLMVTGNFALLAGVHPDEVDAWYLGIYIDALEWVEVTNTRGMSQFADGGLVATKPYVSSANYLQKMGDYCSGCTYDPKQKTGPRACPFNSLYWDFFHRHRNLLERNPRIGMVYRTWDRMGVASREALLQEASGLKQRMDQL